MKQLLAGIVIIFIIGLAGFFYRNEVERPSVTATTSPSSGIACTAEAQVCPDGSAVGRTGPSCTFAECPPPNVEIALASSTISFVLAPGYARIQQGTANQATLRIYQKAAATTTRDINHTLSVARYPITEDKTAAMIMEENTVFDPSGMQATSTDAFKKLVIGKYTYSVIDIGRFEGQVETAYYLVQGNEVYRFDLIERNVLSWAEPALVTSSLPEHQALQQMLATLTISSVQ